MLGKGGRGKGKRNLGRELAGGARNQTEEGEDTGGVGEGRLYCKRGIS